MLGMEPTPTNLTAAATIADTIDRCDFVNGLDDPHDVARTIVTELAAIGLTITEAGS